MTTPRELHFARKEVEIVPRLLRLCSRIHPLDSRNVQRVWDWIDHRTDSHLLWPVLYHAFPALYDQQQFRSTRRAFAIRLA